MKKRLLALLTGLCLFVLMTVPALAVFESGDKYAFIPDDEVVDDDLFIIAEEVVIEGIVNGDVFAAGGKITITGTINGDLYAAGGLIDISGIITQDVIVVGDTITLDGAQIGDGMITAGQLLSIDSSTTLGGGLIYAASNMDMNGTVTRGVIGASAVTSLKGKVGKNVLLATEEFTMLPGAQIQGDLKYWAEAGTKVDESLVLGSIEYVEKNQKVIAERSSFDRFAAQVSGQIWSYFAALVIGGIFISFLPKFYHRTGKEAMEHPAMALVYGFAVLFGMPFAAFLLMITVIGLPLSFITLAKYFIILYCGKIFVAAIFTAALTKWTKWEWLSKGNEFFVFALMLMIFFVLKNLPYVGGVIQGISLLLAWGAMAMTTSETIKVLKKAKL